ATRAWSLPPEGVRRVRCDARAAARDSRRRRGADRIVVLRHGGRLRPRARPFRGVDGDGGGGPVAGGARGAGCDDRRGGHELPPTDLRRRRAPRRASDRRRRGGIVSAAAPLAEAIREALAFEPLGERAGNVTIGRGTLESR